MGKPKKLGYIKPYTPNNKVKDKFWKKYGGKNNENGKNRNRRS